MGQRRRILLVEDDADLAENLAEVLAGLDCDARISESAEQALEWLSAERYDAVITDYRLPGLSGVDLIAAMRARGVPVPIVLTSAYMDDAACRKAEAAGALEVLSKPIDLTRLIELIGNISAPADA